MELITLEEAWAIIVGDDPALWAGIFTAIAIFVVELILIKKQLIFAGDEKRIDRARRAGHIIPATLIKCRYEDKDSSGKTANRKYIATYEYSAFGEVRTVRIVTVGTKPPYSISLYYDSDPGKVFSEYDIKPNPLVFLVYLIPIAMGVAVMKLLGFSA